MTIDLNVAILNLLMRSHHDNRFKCGNVKPVNEISS